MNELSLQRIVTVLALLAIPGVGSGSVRRLLPGVSEAADATALVAAIKTAGIQSKIRGQLVEAVTGRGWQTYLDAAQRTAEQAERASVRIVLWDSPVYPLHLKRITDAPAVLYAKGTAAEDTRTVACVGTREPSAFGRGATERLTRFLGEQGWTVVSGLAKGIDTIAHRAALDVGARTVAILGNGLDTVYPAENRQLAAEIVAAGGLLLSEQPFGSGPTPAHLVQRDRLQSGMSIATIVFETGVDGGAMRTARFTKKQHRLLVCPVPPPKYVDLPSCAGINMLLREGAIPVPGREAYIALVEGLHAAATRTEAGRSEQRSLV